jgi:tetratricopeptide (TPR) repeat protein
LRHHPNRTTLESFLLGTLPKSDLLAVVRHLVSGCKLCRQALAPLAAMSLQRYVEKNRPLRRQRPAELSPRTYDRVFSRAEATAREWQSDFQREREEGRAKVLVVLAQQTADGGLPVHHGPEFWTMGLVEELLERSRAMRHENAEATVQFAQLARLSAENLDPGRYGDGQVADTQARAWAELGNAYRIADDLEQADRALGEARVLAEAGSGDPLLAGSIADLTGSLRCDQRRFPEAFRLLDNAYNLYIDHGTATAAAVF